MKVTTLVLNADGEPHFKSEDQFDIKNLIEIAKTREQNAREKGAQWTAGAVSFFGGEVVKAVNTGEHDDVTRQFFTSSWRRGCSIRCIPALPLLITLNRTCDSPLPQTVASHIRESMP